MTEFSAPARSSYPVDGATLREVADALAHLPEAGRVTWSPSFALQQDASGTVTKAGVSCGFEVHMPVWTGYRAASEPAREEWDRWWTALDAHEQGHIDISGRSVRRHRGRHGRLRGCGRRSRVPRAEARAQADSDAYDAATGHGVSAGTEMDTNAA